MERLTIGMALLAVLYATGYAAGFDFNNGTVQGWTIDGAYDEHGHGPFANNFSATFSWKDEVNWPNTPGLDTLGDNKGSMQIFGSTHGIVNPDATWWIMKFVSPDLSSDAQWQQAQGFTVKIAECMAPYSGVSLYANLYVKVYDYDAGSYQLFYSGTAQKLTHCIYGSQNIWNSLSLDWSGIPTFPTNYTVKNVYVYIWGKMSDAYEGGLYIDEVQPFGHIPSAPTNLQATLLPTQIHLTWQDNANNENGFRLEYKDNFLTPNWTFVANLEPNTISYQYNPAVRNKTYYFRIRAFNLFGDSSWSNEASMYFGYLLQYIDITSPNGGEIWPAGGRRTVAWQNGAFSPPSLVNLYYSLNDGSNWILIAENVANTGSYLWTLPVVSTSRCRVKVAGTSGMPYDISDSSFSIVYKPDLVIESITVSPEKPRIGQTMTIQVKVKNQGQANATSPFWVSWYNQPSPPSPGITGPLSEQVSSLAANSSYTMTKQIQIWDPQTLSMWAQADVMQNVDEANEDNNTFGPQPQDVVEFEWSYEQTGIGGMVGGDNDPQVSPVNIGAGQGITLPYNSIVRYVAFQFLDKFDYHINPEGVGHQVELVVNARKSDGQILSSSHKILPASFNGGWVYFDLNQYICANREIFYTLYLKDGETLGLRSYIAGKYPGGYAGGCGWYGAVYTAGGNMENWAIWSPMNQTDYCFKIGGFYPAYYEADLDHNNLVNLDDLLTLANSWLTGDCGPSQWCQGKDIDCSGMVDLGDWSILSRQWLLD